MILQKKNDGRGERRFFPLSSGFSEASHYRTEAGKNEKEISYRDKSERGLGQKICFFLFIIKDDIGLGSAMSGRPMGEQWFRVN